MPNGERCKNSHERLPMQARQGAAIKEMSREPQFLIAAVRRFLGSDAALPDTEGIDWPVLLRLSDAHAITPMLDSALRDSPIPQVFAEQLRSRFEDSVRYSLAQSGELVRLAELFEKHRVSFVALKGPMLSQYLYGTLGTRTSGDIDVLVREEDIPRIRDILEVWVKHKGGSWKQIEGRPGERPHEYMIGESELPYTYEAHFNGTKHYVTDFKHRASQPLAAAPNSEDAERLSEAEILDLINNPPAESI